LVKASADFSVLFSSFSAASLIASPAFSYVSAAAAQRFSNSAYTAARVD
jgi:hypothetical protein